VPDGKGDCWSDHQPDPNWLQDTDPRPVTPEEFAAERRGGTDGTPDP
jgi:hypothetical protein